MERKKKIPGVVILLSDKTAFKTKAIVREQKGTK